MSKWLVWIALLAAALVLIAGLLLWRTPGGEATTRLILAPQASQAGSDSAGFSRALGPIPLQFPRDSGPHPDYQTEWWYYTGNLATPAGRPFGYQLTLFRRSLQPPSDLPGRASDWGSGQVYMGHLAISDIEGSQHLAAERLSRGAGGLAGAKAEPFQVWLDDWQEEQTGPQTYHLVAKATRQGEPGFTIDLDLTDSTGPVLNGDGGFSPKGSAPGQASYYYSLPRLESQGTLTLGGESFPVSGLSWMDHEFSTSALSQEQTGWDWFSLQLETESNKEPYELMFYQIRRADGSLDPSTSGTLVFPDGHTQHLTGADFSIDPQGRWTSPESKVTYPARWTLKVPSLGLDLEIAPRLADQEMNLSYNYWEGAVSSSGRIAGEPVTGSGYVELTGYGTSMGGKF
jgi:predicted secreted hydrolase